MNEPSPRLDIDDEIDTVARLYVGTATQQPDTGAADEHLGRLFGRDVDLTLFGLGRAVERLTEQIAANEREQRIIVGEYVTRRDRLDRARRILDNAIRDVALNRRALTNGNVKSIDIPTVGVWQTRATGGEYRVADVDAFREWLQGEGREALASKYLEPVPDKVKAGEAKKDLPEIIREHDGEVPPGVTWIPETPTATSPYVKD